MDLYLNELAEIITKFFKEYNDFISLILGVICVIGSIKNYDWLCDPTGKPHATFLTRGLLRFIFLILGCLIVFISLYFILKRF